MTVTDDKLEIVNMAHAISTNILESLADEFKELSTDGNLVGHLQLVCNTVAMIVTKICFATEGMAKEIYGIDKVTAEVVLDLINTIIKDYFKLREEAK